MGQQTADAGPRGDALLTFNTDLLDRKGDLSACLVEGLAAFGESRRLDDLAHARRATGWIPVKRLLSDDGWRADLSSPKSSLSCAEGWLPVHYLMSDPGRTRSLENDLDAIRSRRDSGHRPEDAHASLGDLDALDVALKSDSIELLRQP
jgi:hypothetical protein